MNRISGLFVYNNNVISGNGIKNDTKNGFFGLLFRLSLQFTVKMHNRYAYNLTGFSKTL